MDNTILEHIINSMKYPVMFVDMDHTIQYMNKAAIAHYKKGAALIGSDLLECHKKEETIQTIKDVLEELRNGPDEKFVYKSGSINIYMRAVRDENGEMIGYYQRYEETAH